MTLQFDDFGDGSIAAFWSKSGEAGGHAWSEAGGKLVANLIVYDTWINLYQDVQYTIDTPTDIYFRCDLPAGLSAAEYTEFVIEVYDATTGDYADLYLSYYDSAYYCGAWENNAVTEENEYYETSDHGQAYSWLRMVIGATGYKYFYALTEPTRESDWTELVVPMVTPVTPDFTPGNLSLWLSARAGEGDPPSEQITCDFMSRWSTRNGSFITRPRIV